MPLARETSLLDVGTVISIKSLADMAISPYITRVLRQDSDSVDIRNHGCKVSRPNGHEILPYSICWNTVGVLRVLTVCACHVTGVGCICSV